MRVPHVRFTVRRLMALVAIAALLLGILAERRARFCRLAEGYRRGQSAHSSVVLSLGYNTAVIERAEWLMHLVGKYERAARSPWLPVEPDPPEPE